MYERTSNLSHVYGTLADKITEAYTAQSIDGCLPVVFVNR